MSFHHWTIALSIIVPFLVPFASNRVTGAFCICEIEVQQNSTLFSEQHVAQPNVTMHHVLIMQLFHCL